MSNRTDLPDSKNSAKSKVEDIRAYNLLDDAFEYSEVLLKKGYFSFLKELEVDDYVEHLPDEYINNSRFFNITKLVYSKEEFFIDKLSTIISAVHAVDGTLVSIIKCDGAKHYFYLGIIEKKNEIDVATYSDILDRGIKGNFTGSQLNPIQDSDLPEICKEIKEYKVVSSISNVPSLRSKDDYLEQYVQGVEKVVDSLGNNKYCIINIADSISLSDINIIRNNLKELYKQLSGFEKTEVSVNNNYTITDSNAVSEGFSRTIGWNSSLSQTHTNQTGWSNTVSDGTTKSTSGAAIAAIAGTTLAAAGAAAAIYFSAGTAAVPVAAGVAAGGGALAGGIGHAVSGLFGSKNHTESVTENGSVSESATTQNGQHEDESENNQVTNTQSNGISEGESISFSVTNKRVSSLLSEIDKQLERVDYCVNSGAFNSCTYVLSDDLSVNLLASSLYNAIISGEDSGIQNPQINTWGIWDSQNKDIEAFEKTNQKRITEYLSKFSHPLFKNNNRIFVPKGVETSYSVTPASLVNGKELAVQIGFPKASIPGLSVVYKVPFGRNIRRLGNAGITPLNIGNIYYMGESADSESVNLDKQSICSHTLVAGSTGMGKTNAVLQLLDAITKDENVHFMVVEPAKGEYKNELGGKATIYGTNPKISELLRINPFSFPEEIHVLEHVDRLVDILNVCWPMYAAMPAILKNAIIKSYERCGWDITNSIVDGAKEYPSFADVLYSINEIISNSAYSADNKSDYTGALCTRVESLTVGINGIIFSGAGIRDDELFDRNVIVDLSRIGTADTKALIMGILVMKLQEYRMATHESFNNKLEHVMVLEEAHNLLKKTSTDQSTESSNLTGKSVEMLSNAIAEMRTYGEGFVIVDQAPSLLDSSVIRNTNTKIVLKLPENDDRLIVGKSMGLNDDQIAELAKLEKGCAAVYQNDWEEAVLCKFDLYSDAHQKSFGEYNTPMKLIKPQSYMKKELLRAMLDKVIYPEKEVSLEEIELRNEILNQVSVPFDVKKAIKGIVLDQKARTIQEVSSTVAVLFNCKDPLKNHVFSADITQLNESVIKKVNPELLKMSQVYKDCFIQCLIIEQVKCEPSFKEIGENWVEAIRKGGGI